MERGVGSKGKESRKWMMVNETVRKKRGEESGRNATIIYVKKKARQEGVEIKLERGFGCFQGFWCTQFATRLEEGGK